MNIKRKSKSNLTRSIRESTKNNHKENDNNGKYKHTLMMMTTMTTATTAPTSTTISATTATVNTLTNPKLSGSQISNSNSCNVDTIGKGSNSRNFGFLATSIAPITTTTTENIPNDRRVVKPAMPRASVTIAKTFTSYIHSICCPTFPPSAAAGAVLKAWLLNSRTASTVISALATIGAVALTEATGAIGASDSTSDDLSFLSASTIATNFLLPNTNATSLFISSIASSSNSNSKNASFNRMDLEQWNGNGDSGSGISSIGASGASGSNSNSNSISINTGSDDISFNDSDDLTDDAKAEYIFDRIDVRIIFITLYTLVFCCCFFGNLLVILVVTLSRRLRSITNFFLANLALADFCVGLFCVMQNLSIYLIDSWVFGEFLCRMYQFVHSLSYTASIFILVVICMERYFAIVHPITCKQILTAARLRMVILTVWITSAVYSTPKFVFSKTIKNIHTEDGQEEEICVLDRKMFNSKLLDMINFGLLYVIPLLVMTVLYSKIAIALWRSSKGLSHHIATAAAHHQQQQQENGMSMHNSMHHQHHSHSLQQQQQQQQQQQPQLNHLQHSQTQLTSAQPLPSTSISTPLPGSSTAIGGSATGLSGGGGGGGGSGGGLLSRKQSSKYEKRGITITESQHDNNKVSLDSERPIVSACRKTSFYQSHLHSHTQQQRQQQRVAHMSHSSSNVLRARRGVVRMLIIFVLTFALCNLPYHARKMWQYWSRSYRGDSNFNALLTPLTFLVTYFNSGINPLLYAFLSRNFRKGMKELLLCSLKKGKGKTSTNSSMHHKRMALQNHSLPTDTTHIGNEQL